MTSDLYEPYLASARIGHLTGSHSEPKDWPYNYVQGHHWNLFFTTEDIIYIISTMEKRKR